MNPTDQGVDRLRRRFQNPPPGPIAAGDCPEADRILKAVVGELTPGDNRELAKHAATCAACAASWRVARDYAAESGLSAGGGTPRRWRTVGAVASVAAAIVVAFVLVTGDSPRSPQEPAYRAVQRDNVDSLLPEDGALPVDAFTLRWSAGPAGSRYDVVVTDRRLERIAAARSLDRPEFTVPSGALSNLEPGAVVLWQVDSIHPDGRRVSSGTFVVRLD